MGYFNDVAQSVGSRGDAPIRAECGSSSTEDILAARATIVNGIVLNTGDSITVTASDGNINYDLSGWVVS